MSQSSLLTQLKLQRKLQKSQSQLQISESLDELGEEENEEQEDEEVAGPELQENLGRLVLLHFFWIHFKQVPNQSRSFFDARQERFIKKFFPDGVKKGDFPAFPTKELTKEFPHKVVCVCGNEIAEGHFGVLQSCFACYGMQKRPAYWWPWLNGSIHLIYLSNDWHTWAESVAIQLETKRKSRKSNRNSVTDLEKET